MSKSYVTILKCPWCGNDEGLLLDRRLKEAFEMYTEAPEPCDDCKKLSIMLIDHKTKKIVGWAKKEGLLNEEALKEYEGQTVKALVEQLPEGVRFIENAETDS